MLTIRRPHRLGINGAASGQLLQAGAIGIDGINLRICTMCEHDSQFLAVRGPCRRTVISLEIGQHIALTGHQRLHIDNRLLFFEGNISDFCAIRRPLRGDDRLSRRNDGLRIETVDIRHLQRIAIAHLGDISHACSEDTLLTSKFFIDDVSDLMRRHSQLIGRNVVFHANQLGLLEDVQQTESDFQTVIRQRFYTANGQRLRLQRRPFRVAYF